MSLSRLGARLTKLEYDAHRALWLQDYHASFLRLLAEAGAEIGLAPCRVQELCAVCAEMLDGLRVCMVVDVTEWAARAYAERITAAVITRLETHVPDSQTRYRLRKALSQGCQQKADRQTGTYL